MDPVEQRRIAQAGKDADPGWYFAHRRLSIHLTRAALALGLAADHATFGMMVAGLVGAALLVPAWPPLSALGFVVLYLAFLLDKVDGELARLRGTANGRGIFLDRLHHRLVEPCLFLAVALHEHLRTGSLLPLVAGFATVVLANAIDENQHLAPYVLYKRMREGAGLPDRATPRRSPAWARAAALLRPLKGFRMFIVALPLFALSYVAEWSTGRAVPTFTLAASACGLAVYLVFQCLYYLREQLDTETRAIAGVLEDGMAAPRQRSLDGAARQSLAEGDPLMEHSRLRFGSTLLPAALALAGLAGPAAAAGTYYVNEGSANCSDSGPGTVLNPYCSISAALAARGSAGTTIRVAPGVYEEQVTIPASGTSGSPLVVQGDGTAGNPVIIEGGQSFAGAGLWSSAGGTTWLASSVNWTALMVIVDGEHLVPWEGPVQQLPDMAFKYDPGNGLYVNLGQGGGAGNPGQHDTWVGRRTHGVFVNGRSWVTIKDLHIRRANDRGIQVTNSSNIVIENNHVEHVQRFGIQAQGSNNVRISGNRTTANGDHGITLTAGSTACTVELNETDLNARPGIRAANGIHLFGAPGNTVRRNRIHHNQDTGLHVQAGSDSTRSIQNQSWANGDHGFDHLTVVGSLHVGDVSHGNFMDGFSFEGNALGQRVYDCISAANGLTTGRYNLYVDSTSAIGHVSNDNILWNPTSQEPVKFDKIEYATVAAYAAASGQDTRTIQADPRFVAPGSGDFHLLAGSPAIDAANTGITGWPGSDAEGFSPVDQPGVPNTGVGPVTYADRGAYEYGTGGNVDVPGEPPLSRGLEGVMPNPLSGSGQLVFATARAGALTVDLYDVRGRHVRRLLERDDAPAGLHVAPLDARAADGRLLPAGVYLWRVRSVDGLRDGKFVVAR